LFSSLCSSKLVWILFSSDMIKVVADDQDVVFKYST
jgi:hypothetical protein